MVCLVLLVGSAFCWRYLLSEVAVMNGSVRDMILERPGAVDLKERIARKAGTIDGESGYKILSSCYLSLAKDYDSGASPAAPDSAKIFQVAFAGYGNLYGGLPNFRDEIARFKRIHLKAFGRESSLTFE